MKRLFFSALVLFLVFFSGCTLEPENTYFIDENVTANYFDVNSAVTGLFAGTGIDLNASIGDVLITTDFNNTNAETNCDGNNYLGGDGNCYVPTSPEVATIHNNLTGLQGGDGTDYYHLSLLDYIVLMAQDQNVQIGSSPTFFGDNISDIDHDTTLNYVADQHIDWTNTNEALITTASVATDFLRLWDLGQTGGELQVSWGETNALTKALKFYVNNQHRDINLLGNLKVGLNIVLDQNNQIGASPDFDNANMTGNVSVWNNDAGYITSGGGGTSFTQEMWDGNWQASDNNFSQNADRNNISSTSMDTNNAVTKEAIISNRLIQPFQRTGIGFPVLKMTVNVTNASANYYYRDLTSVANYTIQAGDYLVYSVRMEDANVRAGVDFTYTDASFLRSTLAYDQHSLRSHPSTNHSDYSTERWYQRIIKIPAGEVGKTIQYYDFAIKGLVTGSRTAYFSNVFITDQYGNIRKMIYRGGEDFGGETFTTAQHLASNSSFTSMGDTKDLLAEDFQSTGGMMWNNSSSTVPTTVVYPTLAVKNFDGVHAFGSGSISISGTGGVADNYATLSLRNLGGASNQIWTFSHLDNNHEYSQSYYTGTDWTYPYTMQKDGDASYGAGSASFGVPNDLGAQFGVEGDEVGSIVMLVKAVAGQTENIFEVQNSGGTPIMYVQHDGNVVAPNFIDLTPAWIGTSKQALEQITSVSNKINTKTGALEIDHSSYPEFVRETMTVPIREQTGLECCVLEHYEESEEEYGFYDCRIENTNYKQQETDAYCNPFYETTGYEEIEGRSISATTTMLIEAIKEQQEQIEDLEARIKALELLQVIK